MDCLKRKEEFKSLHKQKEYALQPVKCPQYFFTLQTLIVRSGIEGLNLEGKHYKTFNKLSDKIEDDRGDGNHNRDEPLNPGREKANQPVFERHEKLVKRVDHLILVAADVRRLTLNRSAEHGTRTQRQSLVTSAATRIELAGKSASSLASAVVGDCIIAIKSAGGRG